MDPINQSFSQWLLQEEQARLEAYARYQRYYDGNQKLRVPEKYRSIIENVYKVRANYCDAIVNAPVARLKIDGIDCQDKATLDALTNIWKYNRMDAKCIKLHRNAVKKGDCFAQVWPHFPPGSTTPDRYEIKFLSPEICLPVYATDDAESMLYLRKQWISFDINGQPVAHKWLFYPDKIERYYFVLPKATTSMSVADYFRINWMPDDTDGFPPVVENPYGVNPVIHFRNMEDESPFGTSELQNAIPIQDAINKQIINLLRTSDFQSFKQRYLLGVGEDELPTNAETGKRELASNPGDVWRFEGTPAETTVGELTETDPTGILNSINSLVDHLCSITQTPRTCLQDSTGTASSGFALAKVEAPLISKIKEKQVSFGNAYEDINKLLIRQLQYHGVLAKGEPAETSIIWANLTSDSPQEKLFEAQRKQILKQNRVISAKRWQQDEGYTEEEIAEMQKDIKAEQEAAAAELIGHSFSFDGGGDTATGTESTKGKDADE